MTHADPNPRKDKIFELIVRAYIETAEPVGSRTIARRSSLGLSSASIRNVMADLEEQGFLRQPHTSAGRVPTDKGYRYYVDFLMQPEELAEEEKALISSGISKMKTIEGLAERVSEIISELTDNTAVIYIKNLKRVSFLSDLINELIEAQRLSEFLEEEPELFIEGAFRMFDQPEFQDIQKIRLLLQAFDEKEDLLHILVKDLAEGGVHIHIGRENEAGELEDVSLVVKDYYLGDVAIGGVAVVGPTRMRYSKVVPIVDFVADTVTEAVRRF